MLEFLPSLLVLQDLRWYSLKDPQRKRYALEEIYLFITKQK